MTLFYLVDVEIFVQCFLSLFVDVGDVLYYFSVFEKGDFCTQINRVVYVVARNVTVALFSC